MTKYKEKLLFATSAHTSSPKIITLSGYGVKLWNEIPKTIKENTFFKFKKELKINSLSQYAGTH